MADAVETKKAPKKIKGRQFVWGTGRRKSSVARVRIDEGAGVFKVNGREIDDYFSEMQDRTAVAAPLDLIDGRTTFDTFVNVKGGGHTGQALAIRMGLARALSKSAPDKEADLRDSGFLTRDSRMKERKKYGRRGARRGFQFSKR